MKKIVSVLFFFSGGAGLIYEVVWAKHLSLFLGNTTHAHTIVLATFMGGLALGYFLFGRWADKAKSALGLYGWMEVGIGLFGLLFVPLLEWLGSTYIFFLTRYGVDPLLSLGFKFLLSVFLLLVPTVLMGGTLPVLTRFVVRSIDQVEQGVGWLYFLNSLGAVAGSLMAGFVLIPRFGLNLSIVIAVVLNLGAGMTALALRPRERREIETASPEPAGQGESAAAYNPWQLRIAVVGIALSGGAALIYEVAWIRLLSLVLGSSTYSFSLMLAAFIAGIALGSFIVTRGSISRLEPYRLFGFAELGIALSILLTLPLYERLPFYFAHLASLFVRVPETFWIYQMAQFSICFVLMLLPTLFLGMTLPLASQVASRGLKRLGRDIGGIFAANTAGTLVGAVAAGLLLMPLLGIKRLIEVGVLLNLTVAGFLLLNAPGLALKRKALSLATSLALFLIYLQLFPAWDQNILSSGAFRKRSLAPGMSYRDFKKEQKEEVLYYKDGANTTVAVTRQGNDQVVLKVNGKIDASSRGDLPTQILSGQIPLLLKPDARSVLVIGMGSGITAGSVLRHPVQRLDLVEISPAVVEGSRFFAPHNYHALNDPRLKLHLEDGKTFLKMNSQLYDVVVSEPSNPWIAGVGNLFSVEFYRDVRKRLRPDGLVVQWFHTYEMTDETLRLLLRTFTASFEHVTLWSPIATDLLLIGSMKPLDVDLAKSLARFQNDKVKTDLGRLGIGSFATILSLQVATDESVRKAAGKGRVNEDIFPLLEYEAPKAFFLGRMSNFLIPFDERRYRQNGTSLYFNRYLEDRGMALEESKDIAKYHLTYGSLTRLGLARVFVDLWLELAPQDPEARWALARIEDARGNQWAAREELQSLLQAHPDHPDYLMAAARLEFQAYLNRRSLLHSESPEKVLAYLQRLLALEGSDKSAASRMMAQVYLADRNYKSALRYLDMAATYAKGAKGGPRPDDLWIEAAGAALEMEDTGAALAYIRKAYTFNPDNRQAKQLLEELLRQEREGGHSVTRITQRR